MGRLIKNHWARLIILSAAVYQVAAAIEAFIWPKIFWDFLTPLIYQGTNAAIYYLIGMVVYFWAYSEGEIICAKPWTLPQRGRGGASRV
ncbi:hypothetical protein NW754_012493 [Fusarium falciforme]|nr:hypothetical protein NW754_012493 [Fusarium falciforme]